MSAVTPFSTHIKLDTVQEVDFDCRKTFLRFKLPDKTIYDFASMDHSDYQKLRSLSARLDRLPASSESVKLRGKIDEIRAVWQRTESVERISGDIRKFFIKFKDEKSGQFDFKNMGSSDHLAVREFKERLSAYPNCPEAASKLNKMDHIEKYWFSVAQPKIEALAYYNQVFTAKNVPVTQLETYAKQLSQAPEFDELRSLFAQLIHDQKSASAAAAPAGTNPIDQIRSLEEAEKYLSALCQDTKMASSERSNQIAFLFQLIDSFKSNIIFVPPVRSQAACSPSDFPPRLGHGPNSCFFASILWTLFLNEPVLQTQLDVEIGRLEKLSNLLLCACSESPDAAPLQLAFKSVAGIENGTRDQVLGYLNREDVKGEFQGNPRAGFIPLKDRLAALTGIRNLINEANAAAQAGKSVPIASMVKMRGILSLLNPNYHPNDEATHDVTEIFTILLEPVLKGSALIQNQSTVRKYDVFDGYRPRADSGVDSQGVGEAVQDEFWGELKLSIAKGATIQQLLNGYLTEVGDGSTVARYFIDGQAANTPPSEKKPFQILEIKRQLDTAPPLLFLSLKRFSGLEKNNDPVDVGDGTLSLAAADVKDGVSAKYELTSSINHHGSQSVGHYTASVKKGNQSFYCDDMGTVYPIDHSEFIRSAKEVGYTLIYRKVQ